MGLRAPHDGREQPAQLRDHPATGAILFGHIDDEPIEWRPGGQRVVERADTRMLRCLDACAGARVHEGEAAAHVLERAVHEAVDDATQGVLRAHFRPLDSRMELERAQHVAREAHFAAAHALARLLRLHELHAARAARHHRHAALQHVEAAHDLQRRDGLLAHELDDVDLRRRPPATQVAQPREVAQPRREALFYARLERRLVEAHFDDRAELHGARIHRPAARRRQLAGDGAAPRAGGGGAHRRNDLRCLRLECPHHRGA
mmetsp:Transcript_13069/g.41781  ORF Transcript_13069/g.41781 Transcript_13069/m.41781 type:complete len:261 (-) Transcript_13069:762-1544(-)